MEMSQLKVHSEFADRDPKWLKRFFLGFFLLFPISGLLLFWVDGHAKIEKEALSFTNGSVIPAMQAWGNDDLIDLVSPAIADEFRAGKYDWVPTQLGKLQSVTRLDADGTRAREEDDRGVVYADVDFTGHFEKGEARIHMVIRRLSLQDEKNSTPEDRATTMDEWVVDKLDLQVKP